MYHISDMQWIILTSAIVYCSSQCSGVAITDRNQHSHNRHRLYKPAVKALLSLFAVEHSSLSQKERVRAVDQEGGETDGGNQKQLHVRHRFGFCGERMKLSSMDLRWSENGVDSWISIPRVTGLGCFHLLHRWHIRTVRWPTTSEWCNQLLNPGACYIK